MNYTIISADCHMDAEFMPRDTFTSRVPSAWKERVPRVLDTPKGPFWTIEDTTLRQWGPDTPRPFAGVRGERMVEAGWHQMRAGSADMRVEDQDKDGVDAEVLYGPLRRWKYLNGFDDELANLTFAAYNDYIAEFCRTHPGRFYALGGVPTSVDGIVQELEHIRQLGLVGAELPLLEASAPVWDPYWEPVWAAAADLEVPLHIHTVARGEDMTTAMAKLATNFCTKPFILSFPLCEVIFSGALERHPKLKVVLAESGTGWVPYLLDRIDYEWENMSDWRSLCNTKPSELFRRQMYATFQEDHIGPRLAHLYPDNFMWGSDYPHPDGIWPESQRIIRETMSELPDELRNKILRDNVASLYRIPLEEKVPA